MANINSIKILEWYVNLIDQIGQTGITVTTAWIVSRTPVNPPIINIKLKRHITTFK